MRALCLSDDQFAPSLNYIQLTGASGFPSYAKFAAELFRVYSFIYPPETFRPEMEANPTTTDSISNDGKPPPSNKSKAQASASSKKARKPKTKAPTAEAPRREPSPTAAVDQSESFDPFSALPPKILSCIPTALRDTSRSASRLSSLREQSSSQPPPSRFTAHLQPYPGPYPVPPYPMNGNPYHSSPSPFHQPPNPGTPVNGQNPHVGPGIPGHPPYPYPVHSPYGPHGYPSYPQYPPSGMMMYGTPGPSQVDPTRGQESSAGSPAAQTTGKRKRKYTFYLLHECNFI